MATAIGTYATRAAVKARLGISNTTDDTLLDSLCDQINQYVETTTGRVLAPIPSATYLFDGDGHGELWLPMGVRAVTLLELAPGTGQTFETVGASDYLLRPLAHDRAPSWPATRILLSDAPTTWSRFPRGLANVRVTMEAGWAAIPDDVAELAVTAVVRAWHSRQSGQADIVGTDEYGKPIVSRYLSLRDRDTLLAYTRESPITH